MIVSVIERRGIADALRLIYVSFSSPLISLCAYLIYFYSWFTLFAIGFFTGFFTTTVLILREDYYLSILCTPAGYTHFYVNNK